MDFDFSDRLNPGEGRSYDLTSDEDVSLWNVTADVYSYPTRTLLNSAAVTAIDANTWRVHVTDSMTTGRGATRVVLRVIAQDPVNLNEPEVLEALLTIVPG
jgi:hypothetical protein